MNSTATRFRELLTSHAGWFVLLAALGLAVMGILAIDTVPRLENAEDVTAKQTAWLLISLLAMLLCLWPRSRYISLLTYPAMVVMLALLMVLVLPGVPNVLVPVRNGTRHWINLRFMMLQPSELSKVVFVLAMAHYLRHRANYRTFGGLLIPFALMFIPVGLILKEPDLGTAILFPPVLFAMLLAAGARLRHLGTLAGLGLAVLALTIAMILYLPDSWQLLKPYQVNRVRSMVDLARGGQTYVDHEGYQQAKAMMLVGSGGMTGLGKQRAQTIQRFNWLPEAHNDMVFAVVANRWGLVGAGTLLGLYALLIGALLRISVRSHDPFARLALVGFAAIVCTQVFVNIGMSLGIMPIIGITLPFVSYGGSSLVAGFVMIGLAFNFAAQRPPLLTMPSFEFNQAHDMVP